MSDHTLLRAIITEAAQSVVGTALTPVEQERVMTATMARLRERLGGNILRLYVPKTGTFARVQRAREIRAHYAAGVSTGALAARYGLGVRQVQRLVKTTSSA